MAVGEASTWVGRLYGLSYGSPWKFEAQQHDYVPMVDLSLPELPPSSLSPTSSSLPSSCLESVCTPCRWCRRREEVPSLSSSTTDPFTLSLHGPLLTSCCLVPSLRSLNHTDHFCLALLMCCPWTILQASAHFHKKTVYYWSFPGACQYPSQPTTLTCYRWRSVTAGGSLAAMYCFLYHSEISPSKSCELLSL